MKITSFQVEFYIFSIKTVISYFDPSASAISKTSKSLAVGDCILNYFKSTLTAKKIPVFLTYLKIIIKEY